MVNPWREFVDTWVELKEIILKNLRFPCTTESIATGAVFGVATYVFRSQVLHKPKYVLEISAAASGLFAIVHWPICLFQWVRKEKVRTEIGMKSHTIVVDELQPPSHQDG